MPSPVWLGDDPAFDLDVIIDDFLLGESDDYFDQRPSKKRKRSTADANGQPRNEGTKATTKRQKLLQTDNVAGSSATDPIVVWRTRGHSPITYPVVEAGTGKGVAIFKDWRERSKDSTHDILSEPEQRPSQKSFAVVVERRQPNEGNVMPPAVKSKEKQPARAREAGVNNQSSAALSRAKDSDKRGSAPTTVLRPALAQKGNPTVAAVRKRKLSDLDDEEDELQADSGGFERPKKRVLRESGQPTSTRNSAQSTTIGGRGRKQKAPEAEPLASTASTSPTAPTPKVSAPRNTGKDPNTEAKGTSRPSIRRKKGT